MSLPPITLTPPRRALDLVGRAMHEAGESIAPNERNEAISDCTLHAKSSARRFGGEVESYLPLHKWMDEPKRDVGDFRHRAIRHHMLGVREGVERFGDFIDRGDGRMVSVALVLEQHLMEDCGFLPTVDDWMRNLQPEPWMASAARKLSRELADA